MTSHSAAIIRATMSAVSARASSSSSSSNNEMLYGTLGAEPCMQRHSKRENKTWNSPRKTIKAVDSMGRIEERLNVMEDPKSMMKRNSQSKCKKMNRQLKRYKRLLELSKPKLVSSNEVDDSVTSFKKRKTYSLKRRGNSKLNCFDSGKKLTDQPKNLSCNTTIVKKKPIPIVYRVVTEHIVKLAEPRIRNEMEIRLPGKVVESALFATASKRLLELAVPKNNIRSSIPQENTKSLTRTAYGVSRSALNAACSPRILKLSTPRNLKT